jgi:integrase
MESAGYAVTTIYHAVKLGRRLIAFGEDIGVWNAATARKLRLGFRVPDTVTQAAIEDAVTFGAVIDVPTPLEVDRFIAALTKKHRPYGLMARISATTGLRWAEVVVLRTRDIDLDTGVIKYHSCAETRERRRNRRTTENSEIGSRSKTQHDGAGTRSSSRQKQRARRLAVHNRPRRTPANHIIKLVSNILVETRRTRSWLHPHLA